MTFKKEGGIPKCLLMIPERLTWSLIQNGWILRNKIIWFKPNAMPSSVKDRFSNRWEYLFMFSKSRKYYFDLDTVREKSSSYIEFNQRVRDVKRGYIKSGQYRASEKEIEQYHGKNVTYNPLGKNPGDVFEIPTQPFPEAHFAVFPEKLCEKPIKAGCPEWVCKKCGKARERIIKSTNIHRTLNKGKSGYRIDEIKKEKNKGNSSAGYIKTKTIGWTSCDCNAGFEGGIVLDPFCGAGTACFVARDLRRRFIGIDIKKEYCKMAEKRLRQGVL